MARLRIPMRLIGTSAASSQSELVCWETGWPALHNTLAQTAADLAAAHCLRRESYRAAGIPPEAQITSAADHLDTATNGRVFLLCEQNQPVGTVRVMSGHTQYRRTTFLSGHFEEEIAAQTGCYVEVTHLAIAPPSGSHDPRHILALLQNVTSEADRNRVRFVLAGLDEEHRSFYAALGFREVSEARLLAGFPYPVSLGILDWVQERSRLRDSYTFRRCFSSRNHIQ